MKRRDFIKKAGTAATASLVLPTILPSGRLFAASGARKANHVVFCLFAGGVRNLESVHKAEGNLMPYSFNGSDPISSDILPGMSTLPINSGSSLQSFGTLFKQFRYGQGPTGHYNAHTTAITGNYIVSDIKLRQPPPFPTIFELYRKHSTPSMSALNAWWIADSLGPYPYLNYSNYNGYGPLFGANTITPWSVFSYSADQQLGSPKSFHPDEIGKIDKLRGFFNNQFGLQTTEATSITNDSGDWENVQEFVKRNMNDSADGLHNNPWGVGSSMNGDMYNIFYASQVLQEFKPELLVVNMQGVDVCHSDFTRYCDNIRKADYALGKLWEVIQSTPGLANDTVLIAAPEHGRNQLPNTVIDSYGRFALDHTNDDMSREIFCLVAGPSGVVNQGQEVNSVSGESIDIVPTIANILGFDNEVPSSLMPGRVLNESFV